MAPSMMGKVRMGHSRAVGSNPNSTIIALASVVSTATSSTPKRRTSAGGRVRDTRSEARFSATSASTTAAPTGRRGNGTGPAPAPGSNSQNWTTANTAAIHRTRRTAAAPSRTRWSGKLTAVRASPPRGPWRSLR